MLLKHCQRRRNSNIIFCGLCSATMAAALLTTIGCGRSDDGPAAETTSNSLTLDESVRGNDSTKQPTETGIDSSMTSASPLIGTWWGSGAIDEAATTQLFQSLTPKAQEELAAQAEKFLATEMAIEFKPDATIEMAIEIVTDDNQKQSGLTSGRWTATVRPERKFEVQTTEVAADGTETTSVKMWQLSANGNQLSLDVSMPGTPLEKCGPTIILDRQLNTNAQSAAKVADENGDPNNPSTLR